MQAQAKSEVEELEERVSASGAEKAVLIGLLYSVETQPLLVTP
jgi:hypothetical protein